MQNLLYFFGTLILQLFIIFVSSKPSTIHHSSFSRSANSLNVCKEITIKSFKEICTPIKFQTPCFYNTTFNSDILMVEQIKEESLELTAELCCLSTDYCNREYISNNICCHNGNCLKQCYGHKPPITEYSFDQMRSWDVVENRGMKPPNDLYEKVLLSRRQKHPL